MTMHEPTGPYAPQHSPAPPPREHRDDTNVIVLPRPGRAHRVTHAALNQARATLATAERQIIRARGNRRWRLTMRIDAAHATLRAAGGITA
jgi:hypothetical protein